MYQVLVPGSTTPTVVTPLPVQSATTGVQPGAPYWNGTMSGAPALAVLRRYHASVAGSPTPMPSLRPPDQCPTTGSQPAIPYWKTPASGAPGPTSLRR